MSRGFLVPILLPADPANALEAATKQYVDNKAVGGAGSFFQYTFSTATAAPPATGSVRYNNATPASVTTLYVHYMTNDATDTKTRMLLRRAGDKLYLQDKDSSASYHIYRLLATPTDNTTYATLSVAFDSGAGTFGNNQVLLVGFLTNTIPDGDKGDITTTNSGATWTIDDNTITNAKLADMPTATIRGRTTAGAGDPEDLTAAQATALLNTFGTTTKGLVPAPTTATGAFLKDDGTWAAPAGGGGSVTGTKLSALTALTGTAAATTDVVEVLDVSDTTMAASGTNKKITLAELVIFLNANGITVADGDKGDIVITSGVWAIEANAVTNTKMADASVGTAELIADSVDNTKLANMPANTIRGNNTGAAADPLDLTPTQAKALLAIASTDVSGLGSLATKSTIASADITDGVVSNADLTTMPTLTLKGNNTGSTAAPLDLTVAQVKTLLAILVASETVVGQVELATAAETLTGTDNTRAVHPAALAPLVSGGGPLFGFLFDTTTAAGTSTNGLRINNASPASATAVYVNYTPREGVDLKTRLLAGTAGDRLYIQDRANSANYRIYELTVAPTDNTTYATITVVHRGGGGSLWANGAAIVAGFTAPPITVGTTAPSSPLTNDLWVDTS